MAAVCVRLTRSGGRLILGLDADAERAVFRAASLDSLAGTEALLLARRAFLRGRTVEGADVAIGFGTAVATRLAALHGGALDVEDDAQPLVRERRSTVLRQ